jgi:uncharacterized ion transporter superfamily protein YfcC
LPDKIQKNENKTDSELNQTKEIDDLDNLLIPREALEKLPPETRSVVLAQLKQTTIGFPANPFNNKITSEHLGKIIDSSEKDSEREFEFSKLELKDQQSSKWFFLAIFIISLIFIGFIIVYLSNVDKETMRFVLGIIVGFIGGFGAKGLLPQSKKKSD